MRDSFWIISSAFVLGPPCVLYSYLVTSHAVAPAWVWATGIWWLLVTCIVVKAIRDIALAAQGTGEGITK